MVANPLQRQVFLVAVSTAAFCLALFIVVDTFRAVVPVWSALPWLDGWATVHLIRAWQSGDMTGLHVLFSQHNEHRILVPRLVFFADDWLFQGRGTLSFATIFTIQILHIALFSLVLTRSRPPHAGRWAVVAVVLALMFSLRQAENFASAFQLQFVGVFAGATLSFVLFGLAVVRARQDRSSIGLLLASFAAVLLTTFTMANGLIAAYLLVILAAMARAKPRIVIACIAFALIVTAIYAQGYEAVPHHSQPSQSLQRPLDFVLYVSTYLGSIVGIGDPASATALGLAGIIVTASAVVRAIRCGTIRPGSLAMVGVMLFVGGTAIVTASGRLDFGIVQALSSRYATGSAAFWSAQLVYWSIDPPSWRPRSGRPAVSMEPFGRGLVALAAVLLLIVVMSEQDIEKPQLAAQSFAQNHAADALLLGLYDSDAMAHVSWIEDDEAEMVDVLRSNKLSIFGTADAAAVGAQVATHHSLSGNCEGAVASAVADPALGRDGVRVSGRAADLPRRIRRMLLVDGGGRVVGFGSGGAPGAARNDWQGYAVAPPGTPLIVYGLIDGARLCLLSRVTVAPS